MEVAVEAFQKPYFPGYLLIELIYAEEKYQEFINAREFGFESFGSGVGGLIGIFLGYSFLQIPESVSQLWMWTVLKLHNLKMRFTRNKIND